MLCLLNQSDQQDQLDQVEDELMRVDRNCLLTNSQVEPVDQVDSWLASRQFFRALLVDLQVDLQVDQVDKWTSAEGRWTDARWQKLHAEHLSSPPGDSVTLLQILVRLGHNCIHSLDGLIVALHIFATGKEGTNVHSTFCSPNLNIKESEATVAVWQYCWQGILAATKSSKGDLAWALPGPCLLHLVPPSFLAESGAVLPEIIMVPKCLIISTQNCLFPL